jgi:hypothetical protein
MRSNPFLRTKPVCSQAGIRTPSLLVQNQTCCQLHHSRMPLLPGAGDACTAQDIG